MNHRVIIAYVLSRTLTFPFWGLFYLLPIFLYKDLHASSFQLALLIALKPASSLFSPYWSQMVHRIHDKLIPNLLFGNLLKFIPFLFCPFITAPSFYIFAFGFHMALCRGTIPAWMEVLKLNVSKEKRSKAFALASSLDYLGMALLPFVFGDLLDHIAYSWQWLFPLAALLGMTASLFIQKLPIPQNIPFQIKDSHKTSSLISAPWKDAWHLLVSRKDFAWFQVAFFLGGAGLMIIQPALPKYFVDVLHLSYKDLLFALAALKGIGFVSSSPLWAYIIERKGILLTCIGVTLLAALFPLFLILSASWHILIFASYILYGIMQGGSELSWKMSGPIFSKISNSAPFSSLNVFMVGIRGLIFPFLGTLILTHSMHMYTIFFVAMGLCLSGCLSVILQYRTSLAIEDLSQ